MSSSVNDGADQMAIDVSNREKDQRALTEETLATAVRIFRDAGFVVLPGLAPTEWIERTRDEYAAAYWKAWEQEVENNPGKVEGKGFQGIPGEFGAQGMPLREPFMDELAIANPWAMQILHTVMSEDIFLRLPYGSNTAAPNADAGPQHVHRDTGAQLLPDLPIATTTHNAVVNIALTDFTPENGSTEIWPGTHRLPDHDASDGGDLEARAETMPSVRANMPAGSVVVRDMRMWHRGMPNTTDELRIMLAPVYTHPLLGSEPPDVSVPRSLWDGYSERARHLCRYNAAED